MVVGCIGIFRRETFLIGMISLVVAVKQSGGLRCSEFEGVGVRRGTVLVKRGFAHIQKPQEMVDEKKSMMSFDLKTLELKMQERGTA